MFPNLVFQMMSLLESLYTLAHYCENHKIGNEKFELIVVDQDLC
jgi:hypothetical protein